MTTIMNRYAALHFVKWIAGQRPWVSTAGLTVKESRHKIILVVIITINYLQGGPKSNMNHE